MLDEFRDSALPPLGVQLEDDATTLPFKFIDPEEWRKEEEKKKKIKIQKLRKQLAAKEREIAKWEKAATPPASLFDDKTKYSDFDSEGKPTTDQEGNALPKSTLKRIAKLFSAQDKLHKQYLNKSKENTNFLSQLKEERDDLQSKISSLEKQ